MKVAQATSQILVIRHAHPVLMTLSSGILLLGLWMMWQVLLGQSTDILRAAILVVVPLAALVWIFPVSTIIIDKGDRTINITRQRPLGLSTSAAYSLDALSGVGMRRVRGNCTNGWQIFLNVGKELVPLTEGQANLDDCAGYDATIRAVRAFANVGDLQLPHREAEPSLQAA